MNRARRRPATTNGRLAASCLLLAVCTACGTGPEPSGPNERLPLEAPAAGANRPSQEKTPMASDPNDSRPAAAETATFGAGCFWCVEAVFQQVDGVLSVEPGYAGGSLPDPTYEQVCTGATGHAEVCQIRYDPAKVSYDKLLEVFWKTHDPTTLNRQGPDEGTQYRSVIFYHNERQQEIAQRRRDELDASGAFAAPIVTEIVPFTAFYPAEDYHRDYYRRHSQQPYCRAVIRPKLEKYRQVFENPQSPPR